MDVRQLHYFITVAHEKNYTRAAKYLHIAQPSLSASIKKLEQELGLNLINRTSRDLKLTDEGHILYQEAQKLLRHHEHVTFEMQRLEQQGPLELSIGLIDSSMFFMPTILQQFKQNYEHVKVSLLETLSMNDVKQALHNFDIHLVITNQYIYESDIAMIPLYDEKLVALLPPEHPLTDHPVMHIHDFENVDFIVCKEGFQTRQDILNALVKSGVRPNIQFEIERFETGCSLVENGLGITVVPENYVRYAKQTVCDIKPILGADITRTVYLAYDTNRYLPPIVLSFIALLRTFFTQHD